MTVEEKLVEMLFERGLFEDQAVEIMERVKADTGTKSMEGRWQDQADGYPSQMFAVLWLYVCHHALEWIDENCPKAWFRPMFELPTEKELTA